MNRTEIGRTDLLTPQEIIMIGGTTDFTKKGQLYTPEGFLKKHINLNRAKELRENLEFIEIPWAILGPFGKRINIEGLKLKFKLAKLDEYGDTIADPVIVEVVDRVARGKTSQKFVEREDLTNRFYGMFKEHNIDLHLRGPGIKEAESVSSEHKG